MKMLCRFRQRVLNVIIKAITVSQILFVSVLDHVQRMMDIVELFLRQKICSGVCLVGSAMK